MKPAPKIVERILDALSAARTVCIVGHVRPDGDCVGSQIGLAIALINEGKEVTVWNQDPVPDKLRFLDRQNRLQTPKPGRRFDVVVAVDCASRERLGAVEGCIDDRGVLINIDHHASNTRYGDLNWVSPREPSSGELVHDLCRWAGWKVTAPIADCLFTAVSTDTGSFQYPSTTPDTLHTAAELVEQGADLARICHEVYQSYPMTRVKLLRHVYNRFRLAHDGRTAYFWLKRADFSRTGASTEESEGLIDHIRAIEGVVVAAVFEEMPDNLTRISLRSKDEAVNVAAVAALFGGGGHKAAAGARAPGSPLSVQRRVLSAVRRALDDKAS
jgi:bifunctional oligoribonuclease and PAP phosphatase NrnA